MLMSVWQAGCVHTHTHYENKVLFVGGSKGRRSIPMHLLCKGERVRADRERGMERWLPGGSVEEGQGQGGLLSNDHLRQSVFGILLL